MYHHIHTMSEFQHYLTCNLLIKPRERRRETGILRSFNAIHHKRLLTLDRLFILRICLQVTGKETEQLVFCSQQRKEKCRLESLHKTLGNPVTKMWFYPGLNGLPSAV